MSRLPGCCWSLLESDGVDPEAKNNFGKTALAEAVETGHESIVKLLLESGKINVNSRDQKDALMTPALWGRLSIFKLLLDAGLCECNTKTEGMGMPPLSWAATMGHERVVRLLVDTGRVDLNLPDNSGHTPLWYAAFRSNESITKLLLEAGSVDLCSKDEQALLGLAEYESRKSTLELLQEYGIYTH
jgi:ankyrin repeat protein